MDEKKELVAAKKAELLALTNAFSKEHLDAEYRSLIEELVNAMAKKSPAPFLRGEIKNWAAGIVHALGSINFLFDNSFEPYVSSKQIADYFGVADSTMGQKSKVIRDQFGLEQFGPSWKTKAMQEQWAPMEEMMQQLLGLPPDVNLVESLLAEPSEDDGFVDEDHLVMDEYYDLIEQIGTQGPTVKHQKRFEAMIKEDPDFYDSYVILSGILKESGKSEAGNAILDMGYERAIKRITQKTGEWPELLDWAWIENRHIIRIVLNKAIVEWTKGNTDSALDLLRKLFKSNLNDNIGARNYILAIRTGLEFDEFETKFASQFGYDAMKIERWFNKYSPRYSEEFAEWRKAMKDME